MSNGYYSKTFMVHEFHSTYIILEFELDYIADCSLFTRYLLLCILYLKGKKPFFAFSQPFWLSIFDSEDTLGFKSLSLCRLFHLAQPLPLSQVGQVLLTEGDGSGRWEESSQG